MLWYEDEEDGCIWTKVALKGTIKVGVGGVKHSVSTAVIGRETSEGPASACAARLISDWSELSSSTFFT